MKHILGALLMVAASTGYAMTSLPDVSTQGTGTWKHPAGESGEYTVTLSIEKNHVRSAYKWEGGEEKFDFTAEFKSGGFFTVKGEGGHAIGEGYCGDVQCHYYVRVGAFELEETLTFYEGKVYRLGSKTMDGGRLVWQEALKR